jgi:CheY-like chemotaxis protein
MANDVQNLYTIMLFVKSPGNRKVISDCIAEEGYSCLPVQSDEQMEACLSRPQNRLALVDASGYGKAVWRLCEQLHDHRIPFIVLSPQESLLSSSRAAVYGAVSVIQKPIAKNALMQLLAGFTGRA